MRDVSNGRSSGGEAKGGKSKGKEVGGEVKGEEREGEEKKAKVNGRESEAKEKKVDKEREEGTKDHKEKDKEVTDDMETRNRTRKEKKRAKRAKKAADKLEKEKAASTPKKEDKDIWKNLFEQVTTHGAQLPTLPEKDNKRAENGANGNNVKAATENGNHAAGNGKHVAESGNGKHTENGKHAENGKRFENGKSMENGRHAENGKRSENGKDEKKEVNGRSGFGGLKYTVKDGIPRKSPLSLTSYPLFSSLLLPSSSSHHSLSNVLPQYPQRK